MSLIYDIFSYKYLGILMDIMEDNPFNILFLDELPMCSTGLNGSVRKLQKEKDCL